MYVWGVVSAVVEHSRRKVIMVALEADPRVPPNQNKIYTNMQWEAGTRNFSYARRKNSRNCFKHSFFPAWLNVSFNSLLW